jgi:DNA mismatch repair ATPase MutS
VRRDVVRLVTPGTLTEETLLDARSHNFLTALFRAPAKEGGEAAYALASLDISTGELASSVARRSCRRIARLNRARFWSATIRQAIHRPRRHQEPQRRFANPRPILTRPAAPR